MEESEEGVANESQDEQDSASIDPDFDNLDRGGLNPVSNFFDSEATTSSGSDKWVRRSTRKNNYIFVFNFYNLSLYFIFSCFSCCLKTIILDLNSI